MYMNTDYEFHLMQFADSFFPSGLFSMSNGFESWSKAHKIKSASQVLDFTRQQMILQAAPMDCVIIKQAMNAADAEDINVLVALDQFYYSTKIVREVRNATVRSGRQVVECVNYMISENNIPKAHLVEKFGLEIRRNETPGTYPAVLGLCLACMGIPHDAALRMFLYSFCSGIVASAIRLGVIGHMDGQKILTCLAGPVNEILRNVNSKTVDEVWQTTPFADILQMNHAYDESKMFIT
jgi:urease accessory protein